MPRAKAKAVQGQELKGPWEAEIKAALAWDEVPDGKVAGAIHLVTKLGHALLFGRTADGGALSLTLMWDDRRTKMYAASADEAVAKLDVLMEWAQDLRG